MCVCAREKECVWERACVCIREMFWFCATRLPTSMKHLSEKGTRQRFSPANGQCQGQKLAVTVLFVPYSLDSGGPMPITPMFQLETSDSERERESETEKERECVWGGECVCEQERSCVCERKRESVCQCVCERERCSDSAPPGSPSV